MTVATLTAQTPPKPRSAAKLPDAVWTAFHKTYPAATIKHVSAEREDGTLQYEVETLDGTIHRDVIYLPNGTLVVDEATIALGDVPPPVVTALKARYPKAIVTLYEKLTKPGGVSYEMQLKGAGVKEAEIAPDGTFISPKPVTKK